MDEETLSFKIYTKWDDNLGRYLSSEDPKYDDETDDDEEHADFALFRNKCNAAKDSSYDRSLSPEDSQEDDSSDEEDAFS